MGQLNKILPHFLSPLGVFFGICILSWMFKSRLILFAGITQLIIFSLPFISNILWQILEKDYPLSTPDNIEKHDAIVVLSGVTYVFEANNKIHYQWGDPNRFFKGIELFKNGKASKIIFTQAKMPWSNMPPEGEIYKSKAIDLGANPNDILMTENVVNTYDEGQKVKKLLEEHHLKNVILVSSSSHLTRASHVFKKNSISFTPYASDQKSRDKNIEILDFLPTAEALHSTTSALKELLGITVYKIKK